MTLLPRQISTFSQLIPALPMKISTKREISDRGKAAFWNEIDDLIERFHQNKIKLLPNSKNPPHYRLNNGPDRGYNAVTFYDRNYTVPNHRRKFPTLPPYPYG